MDATPRGTLTPCYLLLLVRSTFILNKAVDIYTFILKQKDKSRGVPYNDVLGQNKINKGHGMLLYKSFVISVQTLGLETRQGKCWQTEAVNAPLSGVGGGAERAITNHLFVRG